MNERGLTLVEVLIALAIFSAVSALGVGAMTLAANGSVQLEETDARVGEMERMRALLRSDLHQFIDREVTEADEEQRRPAFIGGDAAQDLLAERGETILFSLVRSGWGNPELAEPRAELQVVTYLEASGRLIRRTRPFLDAVRDTPVRDDVLIDRIEDPEIRFRERGAWRPEAGRQPGPPPAALRLSFVHPFYGPMEHVFLIGGGA